MRDTRFRSRFTRAERRAAVERTHYETCLAVAADLGAHRNTITEWRKAYAAGKLDEPQPIALASDLQRAA